MSKQELNGHKVCEALGDPTRARILQYLVQAYPQTLTITDIGNSLPDGVSPTTVSFHLRKLREAGLVKSAGHKRGFLALEKALSIRFNGNGIRVEEAK